MSRERHIVITGASSGIGAALATCLANQGWIVHAWARRKDRLAALAARFPDRILPYICDVSEPEHISSASAAVAEHTGALAALVNGAGAFGAIGTIEQVDPLAWIKGVKTNLFGTFLPIHHLLPLLKAHPSARIINFSGGGAFNPFPHYSGYAVSKAAVVRLTETLAVELAPLGICVNAVAPGFVATEIHDATLQAGPEKAGQDQFGDTRQKMDGKAVPMGVAIGCLTYLLSDAADGLTGKTISAGFDPWHTPAFDAQIADINASDLYTMKRINLVNLAPSGLRETLSNPGKRP